MIANECVLITQERCETRFFCTGPVRRRGSRIGAACDWCALATLLICFAPAEPGLEMSIRYDCSSLRFVTEGKHTRKLPAPPLKRKAVPRTGPGATYVWQFVHTLPKRALLL